MVKTKYAHRNDALDYLPRRALTEYAKGQIIYQDRSDRLYLVALGRVKLSRVAANGSQALIRIVPPEGLFGEACLISADSAVVREQATALDRVQIMTWRRDEIQWNIEKQPRLGLALMEKLIASELEMQDRVQAMAVYKTPERVMLSLLQLAHTHGREMPDGASAIASFTHCLIAEHVGTSREIVSCQMSRLRKLGLVRYTRKQIAVYCDAMEELLCGYGITRKPAAPSTAAPRA